MRFKPDENLPAELAEDLRRLGHDAATAILEGLGGAQGATVMVFSDESGHRLASSERVLAAAYVNRKEVIN